MTWLAEAEDSRPGGGGRGRGEGEGGEEEEDGDEDEDSEAAAAEEVRGLDQRRRLTTGPVNSLITARLP